MREAVVVGVARTPIGRAFKGSLVSARPDDMVGTIISEVLAGVPQLPLAEVDDVVVGAANHVGEQGMNLGRCASQLAGLPDSVAGTTVNRGCASSLQAVAMGAHSIIAGMADVVVAAGVESVSRLPSFYDENAFNPRFVDKERDDYLNAMYMSMLETAENVAERYDISRERMDEFALLSQQRAAASIASGFFAREITPYALPDGTVVDKDDCPRPTTTLEGLAKLSPALRSDGRVTAGNSCPLNDGAAAVLVMSAERAEALGVKPLARIVASAVSGLAPEVMGVGPIAAVSKALDRAGMKISDVDVVELNEAFASQVLAVADELGISIEDQLNPHGGSIALGHPFGMTGARIMNTLINDLTTLDKSIGVETMCVGGGMGMAMIIERLG